MAVAKKNPNKDPNFPNQGRLGGMGGQYGRKAANLSAAQLKKAGATKAAAKRTVTISQTSRSDEGVNKGKTLGPGGKPLTGTVKMGNGNVAVYKGGKRVMAAAPKKTGSPRGGGGGGGNSDSSGPKRPEVGTIRKGAAGNAYNKWNGKRWVPVAAARTGRGSGQASSTVSKPVSSPAKPANVGVAAWNALSPAQKRAAISNVSKFARGVGLNPTRIAANVAAGPNSTLAKATSTFTGGSSTPPRGKTGQKYVNGKWVAGDSAAAKAGGPKVGDVKQTMSGRSKWNGTKWVKF